MLASVVNNRQGDGKLHCHVQSRLCLVKPRRTTQAGSTRGPACMSAAACEGLCRCKPTAGHLRLETDAIESCSCRSCCNEGITAKMHPAHTLNTHSQVAAGGAAEQMPGTYVTLGRDKKPAKGQPYSRHTVM
jgi:hypothetical protein